MNAIGGLLTGTAGLVCCGVLFIVLAVGLVLYLLSRAKQGAITSTPPAPPIQSTVEHPTAPPSANEEPPHPPTPGAP